MKKYILVLIYALFFINLSANSHHSHIEYDDNQPIEIIGRVIAANWKNPHVRLKLELTSLDGNQSVWDLEFTDLISLNRRGINSSLVNIGDAIKVYGTPSKRRENTMYASNVLLPNGVEVSVRGRTQPIWSNNNEGFDRISSEDILNGISTISEKGLFRVWLPQAWTERQFSDLPLTDNAISEKIAYSPSTDPTMLCLTPGMPAAMRTTTVHPFSLEEDGDIIILKSEMFDIERVIYMNPNNSINDASISSPLGYSTGSWEGDSLVINTSNIDWPYFDHIGTIRQSHMVNVLEKFMINEDSNYLTYFITINDPQTFTRPVTAEIPMIWRPDMSVLPYNCSLNDNFIH
jgi:hypothetical protein